MAYSRWGSSDFYTFWQANSIDGIDSQTLAIWTADVMQSWSYKQLKELSQYDSECMITEFVVAYNCSRDDAKELIEYVEQFLNDVEEDYRQGRLALNSD